MKIAACSSITSARRARLMSMPINSRSTAAVESRSSHRAMARSVSLEKLRAKARVDCARGPSLASMLMGRPSTKPKALRSPAMASRRAASALKALRWMVSTPVASLRSGSDTATPMVLVPRSSPTSAPRSGQCALASISGRMRADMAPHNTRHVGRAKKNLSSSFTSPMGRGRRAAPGEGIWPNDRTPLAHPSPKGSGSPLASLLQSADRYGIDDALHSAGYLGHAQDKQEFIGLVRGQGRRVHILQNVSARHRQENLVHLEHVLGFKGDDFQRPGVGTDGNDPFADQILCAFDAEAGFP